MTQPIFKDSFLYLERHRQLLQDNIEKLRKSLHHWQTWEAEYEGLKEDILAAGATTTPSELLKIGKSYEGELVTPKEVADIIGSSTIKRDPAQVINVLDRRIDYVGQNVRTIQKQVRAAENKLAAATIVSTPDVRNEEGLPLTDIVEELDEEGNVISSHMSTPDNARPQLLEILQKAGGKETPVANFGAQQADSSSSNAEVPERAKRGVKFSEDTKPGPDIEKSQTSKKIDAVMGLAKRSKKPLRPTVIPADEPSEDAALRQQMIQYGLSEVGSVVAELDIEEDSDWSSDDFERDSMTDDDEDDYGRSVGRVVSEELREQMIALEARLGARAMENIGKPARDYDVATEGIGRIATSVAEEKTPRAPLDDNKGAKKAVRFSESIDVAPPTISIAAPQPAKQAPIGIIIERTVPTGPQGRTLAPEIVERDVSQENLAMEPDEMDSHLLRQEVATAYHKIRNRMIQRQGGFCTEEDSEIVPFTEEEEGLKKMSRFKAARLAANK